MDCPMCPSSAIDSSMPFLTSIPGNMGQPLIVPCVQVQLCYSLLPLLTSIPGNTGRPLIVPCVQVQLYIMLLYIYSFCIAFRDFNVSLWDNL